MCARFHSFAAVSQYNSQQAGITAAIVIAVLIPVGCCLVCLIIRLRQHAIEQRQGYSAANANYAAGGGGNVYKPTTVAAGDYDSDERGGFFSRFQRGGSARRQRHDSDSSTERKFAPAGVHEGTVHQERETLQRDAPPMGMMRDPGTESSAPSTPDSIKKIKQINQHSRTSLNRNSVGMHPDPLLAAAVSHKSLPRGDGSKTNLMIEAGGANSLRRDFLTTTQNDSLLGRSATLPPPPSDLLAHSAGGGNTTLASPPSSSLSRPSTSTASSGGPLKSALKKGGGTSSSSSDSGGGGRADADDAVMAAASAAMANPGPSSTLDSRAAVSPTFFDNRNPYSSTSTSATTSTRSSAKVRKT